MFVRWKRRQLRGSWGRSWERRTGRKSYALDFVLVESLRVDGKPRQRFVAHLAHIDEPLMDMALQRGLFWQEVNGRLDGLQLDAGTRQRITDKILLVVPLPDEAKLAAEKARLAGLERQVRA